MPSYDSDLPSLISPPRVLCHSAPSRNPSPTAVRLSALASRCRVVGSTNPALRGEMNEIAAELVRLARDVG